MRQHKPLVYQEVEGARRVIASRYELSPAGEISFALAAYDRERPLVIDPALAYASYVGATSGDAAYGIAVDADGFAYITGNLFGAFTMTPGAYDTTNAGQDVYVAKINPAGGQFVYATYISAVGGNNAGNDMAVDAQGNAHITGKASGAFFPATPGAYDATSNGTDAFVIKLNAQGNALLYASYLGGTGADEGYGIAVDAAGRHLRGGRHLLEQLPRRGRPANGVRRKPRRLRREAQTGRGRRVRPALFDLSRRRGR